jgi:hypothetical protein
MPKVPVRNSLDFKLFDAVLKHKRMKSVYGNNIFNSPQEMNRICFGLAGEL